MRFSLSACFTLIIAFAWGQAEIQNNAKPWFTRGNSATNPSVNFIGTTDLQDLVFRTNNTEQMRVMSGGNVGIGTVTATQRLHVNGNLRVDNALMPGNNAGTAGQILRSQGAGVAPVWSSLASYVLSSNDNLPDNIIGACNTSSTFSNNVSQAIPDLGTINVVIPVTGLGTSLCKVTLTLNINHTWDNDLVVSLISPSGTIIDVTSDNGGTGDNYTNTVFDDAATSSITTGTAPFTGTFQPEIPFSLLNGQNPNGNWTLQVTDDLGGDVGTFVSANLTIFTAVAGTFVYVGETSVPVATGEKVIVQADYSVKNNSTSGIAIRVSRDVVTGAGSVGTIVGYCADNGSSGTYSSCGISDQDNSLSAGTYYYKLWEYAPSAVAGTKNYSLSISKY